MRQGADYDLTHPTGYGCYCSFTYCQLNNGQHANSSYCKRLDPAIQV